MLFGSIYFHHVCEALVLVLNNTFNGVTFLQAKYLVEAVGAGMGSSLQGFVGKILQR